jgi:hypothetical protein
MKFLDPLLFMALSLSCDFLLPQTVVFQFPSLASGWMDNAHWEWHCYCIGESKSGRLPRNQTEFTVSNPPGRCFLAAARLVNPENGLASSWAYSWNAPEASVTDKFYLRWDKVFFLPAVLELIKSGFPWYRLNPAAFSLHLAERDAPFVRCEEWLARISQAPEDFPLPHFTKAQFWAGQDDLPELKWTSIGFMPEWADLLQRGAPPGDWYAWGDSGAFRCLIQNDRLIYFSLEK